MDVHVATLCAIVNCFICGFTTCRRGSMKASPRWVATCFARAHASLTTPSMPELEGDWDVVHGELITFADPAHDLPPLDRLEGFRPDGHGLYRRALVAVRANTGVETAWVYTWSG